MSNRDDFSASVVRALGMRVGLRCSNPNCGITTSGPHYDIEKAVNVGVAAHITAAAPGGKRYDASLTPEQRSAISNGIWLCETCAKLIDTDELRFTVSLLVRWKKDAEDRALAQVDGSEPKDDPNAHLIRFSVDNWRIHRNRGNLPGDTVIFADGWARGDLLYGCTLRFRNDNSWEDQLHATRIEYHSEQEIVFVDKYAIQTEITLVPRKWVSLEVSTGCHKSNEAKMPGADSLWFAAETVGDNHKVTWKIADIDFDKIRQTE